MKKINFQDNLIINELRKNARGSLIKVGIKHNIPHSTVHDKVKSLEKEIIHKHTSLLNFREMGFDCRVMFVIKLKDYNKKSLREFIEKRNEINNAFEVNHGYDAIIDCVFKTKSEMKVFLTEIKEALYVGEIISYELYDNLKREAFLEG